MISRKIPASTIIIKKKIIQSNLNPRPLFLDHVMSGYVKIESRVIQPISLKPSLMLQI